jgi:prolyl oligopeptidase
MRTFFAIPLLCIAHAACAIDYPSTQKRGVSDAYHGTTVTEDYRWLEDGRDPDVQAWTAKQNALTRATLDAMPERAKLRARFAALNASSTVRYTSFRYANSLFALKRQPPKNQPMLVVMDAAGSEASERVLVDPVALDAKGTTAIDWFEPSPDGRYVAVSLSQGGSEDGSVTVVETATGKALADVVPRVQYPTGGGSVAWKGDDGGFYYTRYPHEGERPAQDSHFYQQVWHHKIGTPIASDTYVLGKEFPRIAETSFATTRDGRYVLAAVRNGDGGEVAFWLRGPDERWARFADFGDGVKHVSLGFDGNLYALSRKNAPHGQVLAMPLASPNLARARVVIAAGKPVLENVVATKSRLYVTSMEGGPTEVHLFTLDGKPAADKLPAEAVSRNTVGQRLEGDEVMLGSTSYLSPFAWYRYSPSGGKLVPTRFLEKSLVDFKDAEVVREMAKSRDGTLVPVNLVMKKGTKRDGNNPVLLYGYGGYGLSMQPVFSERVRVWLDAGGIYAVVNLRGGGEFGEEWHLAGNLVKKQNVFDDMIGAAEHLVARGYTKPQRMAAMGGSNGGLLMGAILTQRPDLFRAIVSAVGIYDSLRVELTPNGAFNVTEFGSVKDKPQFDALYAYSPYHRVKDGVAYPAVLLTAGANDGRVDPANSRKMAARLQAASTSGHPVLVRISGDTGHGQGMSMATRVEQDADAYGFLMHELGMAPAP